jgi:hypothetical protein
MDFVSYDSQNVSSWVLITDLIHKFGLSNGNVRKEDKNLMARAIKFLIVYHLNIPSMGSSIIFFHVVAITSPMTLFLNFFQPVFVHIV